MAVIFAFVLVIAAFTNTVSNAESCYSACQCTVLVDTTFAINCSKQLSSGFREDWPAGTSKLDLSSNGLTSIKWSVLASLEKLKELVLTGNNINCNCEYYNYWKNKIQTSVITVDGQCMEPSNRKGRPLSQAGADMAEHCDQSSVSSVKTTLVVLTTTKQPTQSSFQNQVKPTATLPAVTTTSKTKELKTVVLAPVSTLERSSSDMPSTPSPSAHAPSSTSSVAAAVVPAPVQTTTSSSPEAPTTTLQSPSTSVELTTTTPPPPTTEQPTTEQPAVTSAEATTTPPPTTKPTTEPTTTTEPVPAIVRTEETTTERPTIPPTPPKPGPPSITLYTINNMVKLGSVVDVRCEVGGFPKPTINMIVNGQDAKAIPGMFILDKNGAKVVFEAKFTTEVICYAKNKFGEKKKTLKVVVQQQTISYFSLMVKLHKEKYSDDYKDKGSEKFQNLQKQINDEFSYIFKEFYGFFGASLISARSGSVIVDVLVKTSNSTRSRAKKLLEEEIQIAKLGSLPVDRYYYSFTDKTRVCAGEFLNITWSDTLVNQTAVQKCPRGAIGVARRNCTDFGWYFPDYTQCKSDPFTEVKKEMSSATSGNANTPNMDILSILKDVKNMTVTHKDYSHLAGDLNSCVEMIGMLTNYTKHHRNDIAFNEEEAQLVVDITSNLLNKNHEQEFIISQKLIQKASTLIRVVEQYGLQAAVAVNNDTEELKFFIAENVVMGAGIVEPLSITKDVTFPNYDIKEIDVIRTDWGSSSFIVIDKEIIEELTKVKRFKVAGFLYRTLTRILSAESAYSMVGQGYEINSAVVSLTLEPPLPPKLKTPVIIASNNLEAVQLEADSPICAFWDFNLNKPNGGWSDKGCWYTHYNTHNTTCLCEHLTNFAVLKEKPVFFPQALRAPLVAPPFLLCLLIGCIIMICFCAITLFLLLIFAWRMKPDRTWGMHMFVCATLITAFALIIVGLYKYNDSIFLCRLLSMLVHYFVLCAITWIMAEATYMYVWTKTEGPKKRYWIGYFFLGFVPPGVPLTIAWLLEGMSRFESTVSCWMSLLNNLLWVFFVPAVIFLLITILIFRQVWKTATGNLRVPLKALYWRTRFRVHVRYSVAIQILLILTWLSGLLVITYHMLPLYNLIFCVLFIVLCAITGLVIIVFYCLADRQFDDAFRECCCFCCRRGKYKVREREDLWPGPIAQAEVVEHHESFVEEEQQQDPLIVYVTRRPPASEPSMSSIDDPLYDRVKKPGEEEPMIVAEKEQKPEEEPVYAKVYKDEEYEEHDPFPVAQPGSPRFLRGLTRMEVIRMAKKSDAAKKELKKYESPKGSQDDLAEHPTYLLNQQELDEELQHFRTFFAEGKESSPKPSSSTTPPGTPTPSPLPRTYSAASSSSSTTKTTRVMKMTTSKKTTASTFGKTDESHTRSQTHESFESSSTFTHESTRIARSESPDWDTPPAIPPRAPDLLDDDDDDDDDVKKDSDDKAKLLDVERDDESLTDVSATDDFDKDSDEGEGSYFLDGSRPTAV